jgi:hypothetical protein
LPAALNIALQRKKGQAVRLSFFFELLVAYELLLLLPPLPELELPLSPPSPPTASRTLSTTLLTA